MCNFLFEKTSILIYRSKCNNAGFNATLLILQENWHWCEIKWMKLLNKMNKMQISPEIAGNIIYTPN